MRSSIAQLKTYDGAVAIITGGASGIGEALGRELASRGCAVVLADLNHEQATVVATSICALGGKASAHALNVTDATAVEELLEATGDRYGRLDYMFNNAGIALNGKLQDFELPHWQHILDINLMGTVHGLIAAQQFMIRQGFGHIVNTASFARVFPWPTTIPYTASKHAIVGMSLAARAELADCGIHVSVLCPGTIMTPMIEEGASPQRWVGSYSQAKLDTFFKGAKGMEPGLFAKKALHRIKKNDPVIVIPASYKALWYINRLSPSLAVKVSQQIYGAIMKRVT